MLKKNGLKQFLYAYQLSLIGILLTQNFLETAYAGSSASTTARITASVRKSISIEKINDLDFGSSYQGEGSSTITADMKNAAQFIVNGEPQKAFNIVLPETVTLQLNDSREKDQIAVSKFTSYPNKRGLLDKTGKTNVAVGATREKLGNKTPGDYSGEFTITVTYQ